MPAGTPIHPHPRQHRTMRALITVALAAVVAAGAVLAAPAPAHAASQGTGFGEWAPISAYGWHGSMLIDGVHTYCILPGAPAPTGPSTDQGISATAAGLSPQQLSGINLLITKYGQTSDPVQAAAVGWAVKATANWTESLHHFGYSGDSLAGAIHWTFSALAPDHDAEIQRLAVTYYDEARAAPIGVAAASGRVNFTTDAADPALGSVRVDASTAATGTLTLTNATFAESGSATHAEVVAGVEYAIVAVPPAAGRAFEVSASGRFSAGAAAAVRHFTTPGGQDTAGPAGPIEFDVAGKDAAPRHPRFAPTVSTQVAAREVAGGPFVDDVMFGGSLEHWPRALDGSPLPLAATATVYRTEAEPALGDGSVPEDAMPVGSLAVQTDAATGPTGTYRVTSLWELPGAGFYTAVWTISGAEQMPEVVAHLPAGFGWVEPFGEPTQIMRVPEVPAEPEAPEARPATLAATGRDPDSTRAPAGLAVTLLTLGATLLGLRYRRRFVARSSIG